MAPQKPPNGTLDFIMGGSVRTPAGEHRLAAKRLPDATTDVQKRCALTAIQEQEKLTGAQAGACVITVGCNGEFLVGLQGTDEMMADWPEILPRVLGRVSHKMRRMSGKTF